MQLAISRTKNQKKLTRSIFAKSHCQISDQRLNWLGSRTCWAPDLIEMGPEWFGILAQVKTGPRQKWDILSKLERDYVNNSKWRQLAISRTKNQKITRSMCAKSHCQISGLGLNWHRSRTLRPRSSLDGSWMIWDLGPRTFESQTKLKWVLNDFGSWPKVRRVQDKNETF